jgi:hypothetical protein
VISSGHRALAGLIIFLALFCSSPQDEPNPEGLRIGIIGLDTSHVVAFTKIFNDPEAKGELATMRVVAAYPGGTDIPTSRDRVKGFTKQLEGMAVEIVNTVPALLKKVDVVLLESVDGRPHLEQVRLVFAAGKRVFIDKPLAGSLADAVHIEVLGRKHKVEWWSSSSLRFGAPAPKEIGQVTGCAAWSPCSLEPHHPDLFWYGIHGVESLFAMMGPGCESVTRAQTAGTELVTGIWNDGRIGTFRGIRDGKAGHGATLFGTKGIAPRPKYPGYLPLVKEIATFFRTGKAPVSNAETLEIYAFMEAADASKRQAGAPISISRTLSRARALVAERKR